jgi:tetratricopeptide (TPR) repeat protein
LLPSDALTHDTLGTVLTLVGRYEGAADQFATATRLAPSNAQFRYNYASALLFCGRLEAAEAAFEQVLRTNPDHVQAHLALAENFAAPGQMERLRRLEATLSRVQGSVDDALVMHQALARTLEANGQTAAAFRHFESGKQAKKRAVGYTIEEDKRVFAAIDELFFTGSAAAADLSRGAESGAPIFVFGMPRTGTTLVDRIVSTHSGVVSGGELSSLPESVWEAGGRQGRINSPGGWSRALASDPRAIGERYLEHAATLVGAAERFIDKRPLNFLLVGFIRRSLPNAKLVCLRRGALDTCVANFRHLFALNFGGYRYALTLEDTAEYFALFEHLMGRWDALYPGAIYHLHYEDLVADFDGEIRRLLEFLELPYEDALADFHANEAAVATASAVQVRQPLYRTSVGAWRRYEAQLGPLKQRLSELGIDLSGSGGLAAGSRPQSVSD